MKLSEERRRTQRSLGEARRRYETLTDGEREVVLLASEGLTNKAIAMQLCVSPQAIDARRIKAMEKLGVGSVADLIRLTIQLGLAREASEGEA